MKGKVKGFFDEFKKFITRGNVLDMSVGVIVGGAFTAIVNGMSNFILKPLINWLLALILGENSLDKVFTFLKKVEVVDPETQLKTIDLVNSIYIDWGSFISAIINFLIVAFVLFVITNCNVITITLYHVAICTFTINIITAPTHIYTI